MRRIKMLGSAGMTLGNHPTIAAVCDERRSSVQAVQRAAQNLAQQVGLIDERIETLSQSRTILAGFLASVT